MKSRIATIALAALVIVGGGIWFGPKLIAHWRAPAARGELAGDEPAAGGEPTFIDVLPEVVELTGIRTAAARPPSRPRELNVSGDLSIDPNRLVHIHARFPGQVVELATVEERNALALPGSLKVRRDVSFMDHVAKGDRLGVLWSKELGEKKSELVAALIRWRTDQINLERLQKLYEEGGAPERSLRDAENEVDLDETKVESARWTLRSWALTADEIAEVEAEAERIRKERGNRRLGKVKLEENWARVELIAPIDGTIVEKNVVKGNLVDTDDDLFKIADLSTLAVRGQVYEEDLPALQSMPRPIPWKIRISSNPEAAPISGEINIIGDIVNPFTHMVLVIGSVANPDESLFAGQFITATIQLPPEADVVEIPTRGLVEDGNESVVLVKVDPKQDRFYRRRVSVVRRYHDVVHLRSRLTPEQKALGFEELHEGEWVVSAGALELKAALAAQQPDEDEPPAGKK